MIIKINKDHKRATSPAQCADAWEGWCGPTLWSKYMRALEGGGRYVVWWCGYPQCNSAIPLTFRVYNEADEPLTRGDSLLRELHQAVSDLQKKQKE